MMGTAEYLLVLYIAEQREGAPVAPGDVAARLGRSPSATTEMLQRLDARGLIAYEPYEGATLTEFGRDTAHDVYETYRILSQFFRDVLGLEAYDAEAMQLAGTISKSVAERLAATLLVSESSPAPP
ncbi:metal-dependent transcriptional regulator [Haladaptatus sp. ZSTT2]|uniref:metal-dependent transcriptional regulator n=1 Tax=Haladaptatus sp. ZSTT2 TaxID=3120515 RepID=UPI003FA54F76